MKLSCLLLAICCSFSALSAQWEPDQRLTDDPASSRTAENSNTWTVGASGDTVHVVWADNRDGNDEIYYNRDPTGNVGGEESLKPQTPSPKPIPTIVRGMLSMPISLFALRSSP
jgi:hypothetical protein